MFTRFPTYSQGFLGNNMQHFTMLPSGVCACWPIYLRFLNGLLSKYFLGPTLIAFWEKPSLSRVAISYDIDGPRLDCLLHYNYKSAKSMSKYSLANSSYNRQRRGLWQEAEGNSLAQYLEGSPFLLPVCFITFFLSYPIIVWWYNSYDENCPNFTVIARWH